MIIIMILVNNDVPNHDDYCDNDDKCSDICLNGDNNDHQSKLTT